MQHAQLGMPNRAIDEFRAAVAADPALEAARLQLGLLLAGLDRDEESRAMFASLEASTDAPLRLFDHAMVALLDGDVPRARAQLDQVLAEAAVQPALGALTRNLQRRLEDGGQEFRSAYLRGYGETAVQ